MTESGKNSDDNSGSDSRPEFASPFDYDATAEASLSEPPATSESGPVTGATGSGSGSGPGWNVHSGVGNGPGWGDAPSYPPPNADYGPSSSGGVNFEKSAGADGAGSSGQYGEAAYGSGPVYGPPDPNYPQADWFDGPGPYSPPNQGYPAPDYLQSGYQQPSSPPGYSSPPGFSSAPGYGPPPGYGAQPAYGYGGQYGIDPTAPYGRHPISGEPLSDKSKLTAGLLEILLGAFGAGRFYLNQPGIAVAQIAVTWLTCGIGGIWPLIDGIMMLTGSVRDEHGRPLRD